MASGPHPPPLFHHVYHILEAARQQGRVSEDQRGFIPTTSLVMVDFNFDVNELFRAEITAVRSDLIPVGYLGNKNHSLVQQQVGKRKEGKQNKTKQKCAKQRSEARASQIKDHLQNIRPCRSLCQALHTLTSQIVANGHVLNIY